MNGETIDFMTLSWLIYHGIHNAELIISWFFQISSTNK
jgi:hypothetical protein